MSRITVGFNELTDSQKEHAREQYIYIRACEEEISEEEASKKYDTSDESMDCRSYEIDTTDEDYLFVDV